MILCLHLSVTSPSSLAEDEEMKRQLNGKAQKKGEVKREPHEESESRKVFLLHILTTPWS